MHRVRSNDERVFDRELWIFQPRQVEYDQIPSATMRTAKTSVTVLFRIDASAIFMEGGSGVVCLHPPDLHAL